MLTARTGATACGLTRDALWWWRLTRFASYMHKSGKGFRTGEGADTEGTAQWVGPCAWLSYFADKHVVTQEAREYLLGKTDSPESNIYA